jgi:hypothetical protein
MYILLKNVFYVKSKGTEVQKVLRQQRILSAVTVLALILTLFAWTAATAPAANAAAPATAVPYTGQTAQGDYTIRTAAQLAKLASVVNTTTPKGSVYAGSNFYLIADIDLSQSDNYSGLTWTGGTAWTPIGGAGTYSGGLPGGNSFAGTFDGYRDNYSPTYNTHTISSLNIPSSSYTTNYGGYGLFGYVNGGAIMHLTVSGQVGDTLPDDPYMKNTDPSVSAVGGIVGYTNSTLYNLHNEVNVTVNNDNASQAGGVAGTVENNGATVVSVQYCSNIGDVTGRGRVGGIVGAVYCASNGGVVVDNCFNKGDLMTVGTTQKSYTGGIVGYCRGYITNSYSIANLATKGGHYIAGIVGILQNAGPQAAMSNVYTKSVFTGAAAGYDRFLFGSADTGMQVPIANALWVNNNPQPGNINLMQPDGATGANWGTWTDVGYFANTSTTTATNVYTTSTGTWNAAKTAISILNGASSIIPTAVGAFEQDDNAYPNLKWEGAPNSIGRTPGTPGTTDTDDATQIFLDVTAATDGDGTKESPFNNLTSALDGLKNSATGQTTIYVKGGAVSVSTGDTVSVTSAVTGATIKRSSTYRGYLFNISGGDVTVENITVDGNLANVGAGNSLIYINGGTLTVGENGILQENLAVKGGAIYADGGTVKLNGGRIRDNIVSTNLMSAGAQGAFGGGIYIDGADVLLNPGYIERNHATSHINNGVAYGGGIYLGSGSLTAYSDGFGENSADGGKDPSNGLGAGIYVGGGTFTVTPDGAVEINDAVYLPTGQVIRVGASLIDSEIEVQAENPAAGVPVAEVSGTYTAFDREEDPYAFRYADGNYEFEVNPEDNTQIILKEETR